MTMQTFVVLFLGVSLGYKIGLASIGLYLLEGIVGLPVFSNSPEKGVGLIYFTGPTMGYLIGFMVSTFLSGYLKPINNLFTIDGPFMSISSLDELKQESMLSSKMGFNGKAAIHPSQIDSILEAFLPTNKEIEEAKEVLKAFSAASDGAVALNGTMIDLPVVRSMERRLRLAGVDPDDFR